MSHGPASPRPAAAWLSTGYTRLRPPGLKEIEMPRQGAHAWFGDRRPSLPQRVARAFTPPVAETLFHSRTVPWWRRAGGWLDPPNYAATHPSQASNAASAHHPPSALCASQSFRSSRFMPARQGGGGACGACLGHKSVHDSFPHDSCHARTRRVLQKCRRPCGPRCACVLRRASRAVAASLAAATLHFRRVGVSPRGFAFATGCPQALASFLASQTCNPLCVGSAGLEDWGSHGVIAQAGHSEAPAEPCRDFMQCTSDGAARAEHQRASRSGAVTSRGLGVLGRTS